MNDEVWVLASYSGDVIEPGSLLNYTQAMSKQRWGKMGTKYFNAAAWQVIAEGTEEEMKALEKLTGVNT
jgi:hypothetical protein